MTDATEQQLETALAPLRERLMTHPLYAHLRDEETLRIFMAAHVFAVWDFQSLLKALQRLVTCVEVPWLLFPFRTLPPGDAKAWSERHTD
jgi:hypothetical protein